jgi:hypothetical protein
MLNRRILVAAICVNNRAVFYQTSLSRPIKSVGDELRLHPRGHLPADNPMRGFVLKGSQVTEPPILQWQVSNIADNHFSFVGRLARWLQQIRTVSKIML